MYGLIHKTSENDKLLSKMAIKSYKEHGKILWKTPQMNITHVPSGPSHLQLGRGLWVKE